VNETEDIHLCYVAEALHLPYIEARKRFDEGDPEVRRLRVFFKRLNFMRFSGLSTARSMQYIGPTDETFSKVGGRQEQASRDALTALSGGRAKP
jgi:hypothetical protein